MRRFQAPVTIEGIGTLKDGGLSIRLHSQELSANDTLTLLGFKNSFGYMLFQEQEFKDDEELKLEAIRKDTQGKSPSQRMRAVIFKLWEQGGRQGNFDTYYGEVSERIINQLKDKLD